MNRLTLVLVVCLLTSSTWAMEKWQDFCQQGGVKVSMPSLGTSTSKFMQSFPGCTVTVYDSGTSNLSTIYSDDGVTPKSNPFTGDSTTGYAFFFAADGVYDVKFSGAGIASPFTNSGFTLFDSTSPASLGSLHFASAGAGSDWCAQAMSVDNAYAGQPLFLIIDNLVQSTAACSADPKTAANHTWWFDESTTFSLGARSLAPAGSNTRIYGQGYGTILTGTTGWLYDNDTHPGSYLGDIQFQPAITATGGIRFQHQTSNNEANNWVRHVKVTGAAWTSGQIGVEFKNDAFNDSLYHDDVEIQTLQMDIGAKFISTVNNNGPNGNILHIKCNLHTVCVDVPDGTDESIYASCLGAHGLTNGICARLGGTGGGYGASNNTVQFDASEQGGTSKTIQFLSGAAVNTFSGAANDSTNVDDSSGVLSNRGELLGVWYHPAIASNCLPLGGGETTGNAALCRSSTTLYAALGDDSAKTIFGASKYQLSINSALTDALTTQRWYLGNNSNIRQASAWGGVVSNLFTLSLMTNNTTADGSTFSSFNPAYGSWTVACQANTADVNSLCGWWLRGAGAGEGIGTQVMKLSNAGQLTLLGGVVPSTAGGATSGSGVLPWSSVYIGGATNHYIQITGAPNTGQIATLPNNTGTLAELNLAQAWSAKQTFSAGLDGGAIGITNAGPITGATTITAQTVNATTALQANGTPGASSTVVVKGSAGSNCNLVFSEGLFVSTTCP